MIATLLQEMADPRVGIAECGLQEICKTSSDVYLSCKTRMASKTAVSHVLLWDGSVGTAMWNKLFRRSVIGPRRFQEELRYGEDSPFLYEVLKHTDIYVQIPYVGYYHERRNESLVQKIGVTGVIAATIVTNLALCHVIEPYVLYKNAFCTSPKKYYAKNYSMIALFLVQLLCLDRLMVCNHSRWAELLANGSVSVLISALGCIFLLLLDKESRKLANTVLRKKMG